MLSVWWGVKEIIYWEPLPNRCTVTTNFYCQQLDRVIQKLMGKQDRVYFLYDSTGPHVAELILKKLLEFEWITVSHLPYSPGLAPADYRLFRSLSNHLREKKFDDESNLKTDLADFFSQKSKDFYESGIFSLPGSWRQVVHSDGAYIIEN